MSKTKTIIVDDHSVMRDGVQAMLRATGDFDVVAACSDSEETLDLARKLEPELMLVGVSMPKSTGIEAIERLTRVCPETKVLALTSHREASVARSALDAGAHGYVLKDDGREELFGAIKHVLAGQTYVSPTIADEVLVEKSNSNKALSQRESEIVKLIAEGYRTQEIADYLSISLKTVETHRAKLMKKFALKNAPEVTRFAIKLGLIY